MNVSVTAALALSVPALIRYVSAGSHDEELVNLHKLTLLLTWP
jgi:hypothetical protein